MLRIELREEASAELDAAVSWYGEESWTVARSFAAALDDALERIAEAPERWPRDLADTRRLVLRRFPFSVVYRITDTAVVVIAFPHHGRQPKYWIRRVERGD